MLQSLLSTSETFESVTGHQQVQGDLIYTLHIIFDELMNVSVWKAVKRVIKILRTAVSTHNALNARHSWHLQLTLEKQQIFVIAPQTHVPMSAVCCFDF